MWIVSCILKYRFELQSIPINITSVFFQALSLSCNIFCSSCWKRPLWFIKKTFLSFLQPLKVEKTFLPVIFLRPQRLYCPGVAIVTVMVTTTVKSFPLVDGIRLLVWFKTRWIRRERRQDVAGVPGISSACDWSLSAGLRDDWLTCLMRKQGGKVRNRGIVLLPEDGETLSELFGCS